MSPLDETGPWEIEVILFDASGTLIRTAEPVWEVYASVGREFRWQMDPARLRAVFREVWSSMPEPDWECLQGDPEKAWWRSLVHRVVQAAGVVEPGDAFDLYFTNLWEFYARADAWVLYEEVVQVLCDLRKAGYRLGVLSNFDDRLVPVLQGLGVFELFEAVTISSQARARKPGLAVFTHALQAHGVAPRNVLHVGDDPVADWAGAKGAGVRWFELRRPENTLRSMVGSLCLC